MTFSGYVSQPAIPTAAERDLGVGPCRYSLDPESVVQHLNVDAQFIHVPEAQIDIVQLARRLGRFKVSTGALGEIMDLALAQSEETKAGDLIVDHPILPGRIGRRGIELWTVFLFRLIQIVPRALGLDHMSIGVDDGN